MNDETSAPQVAKLRPWSSDPSTRGDRLYMYCPGCDDLHAVEVTEPSRKWEWDGSLISPTIGDR